MKDTRNMTMDELRAYRVGLCRDAVAFHKPDRTPHMSFYITWPVTDAGYKLSEALHNWDVMEDAIVQHQQKYNFDVIQCLGTRNPCKISEALGSQRYKINDEAGIISVQDSAPFAHEDLRRLADDPVRAQWEIMMPHKFPLFRPGVGVEPFNQALHEQREYFSYVGRINRRMTTEFGVPAASDGALGFASPGVEALFGFMRGIKGFAYDMRKDPELVKAAADALDRMTLDPCFDLIEKAPEGPNEEVCFDFMLLSLAHTIMSNRQFEFFLWPKLKKLIDLLIAKGKTVRVYFHGALDRFYEYFQDYPKGSLIFMVEANSLWDVRERLPNVALCGGLTTLMMGTASAEECVRQTKRLIDELGADGGLVLSLNTMGSFPTDTKAENLRAVSEFIQTYEG